MKIFGTDGVRGKAGVDLTAMVALRLGLAAGIYFQRAGGSKILVGKDTRKSGYMVENSLVSGLTAVGLDVIQIGPMPTPAIAFLTEDMRCDAGLMISASHNPFYDNGIKFFDKHGLKLFEDKEALIEEIYLGVDSMHCYKTGKDLGYSRRIDDVVGRYIVHIKNSFPKDLNLQGVRLVLDCANGAAYKVGPSVFRELGADVIVLNENPNGYNINENCGALYPEALSREVKRMRADVGFALDGDADRLVVVDESGALVPGDSLLGALALFEKTRGRLSNQGMVATIMSNQALEDFLSSHGIALRRCGVGDRFVLQEMLRLGYVFGGEQSGHVIFSNFSKTGDGLVSALQVLALMVTSQKPSSKILSPFTLYPQLQVNIPVTKKPPLEDIEGLDSLIKEIEAGGLRQLLRYSGTENKLRILLEGRDLAPLEKYGALLEEFLSEKLG